MGQVAFYVEVLAIVAIAAVLVRQVRNLSALPEPLEVRRARGRELPALSVVIPVVERGDDLDTCLAAVLAQGYPGLEVIVVDARDGRSGRLPFSPERADDPRLRVLAAEPAPGWTRRNRALHAGGAASRNEWVLFLDPAVYLKADALVRAAGTARWYGVEALMLIPELTATLPGERLLVPFVAQLALTSLPARSINDPAEPTVPAHASFLLFRRSAYASVRRDPSIRGEQFYEVALARCIKAARHKVLLTRGSELAIQRTPGRLGGIWRSWARSFNAAIAGDRRRAVATALLLLLVFALPWLLVLFAPVALILGTSGASSPWTGVLLMGSAHVLLALTIRRWMRDAFGIDDSLAWLQPAAAAITALMLVASTVHLEGVVGEWVDRLGLALGGRESPI